MDFDAQASTWMPLPPWRPAVTLTLTFDLLNLFRSLVGASEYFRRDCSSRSWDRGNKTYPDERTDESGGRIAQRYNAFVDIVGWRKNK